MAHAFHMSWHPQHLVLLVLLLVAVEGAAEQNTEAYSPGLHDVDLKVDDHHRKFLVYMPKAIAPDRSMPLLLLLPGHGNPPHEFLKWPDMIQFANHEGFVILVLIGVQNQFNVGLNSLPANANGPDDVAYTKTVLRKASLRLRIDTRRVFCVGMSMGGRFCVRLASELSSIIAAIGLVSALRFPEPNHAKHPMPLIAFHGTADEIDCYWGGGRFVKYWGTATVPDELHKWASFNGCQEGHSTNQKYQVTVENNTRCSNGADVILYTLPGAKHSWPGSPSIYGPQTYMVNVTKLMWHFLNAHPMRQSTDEAWQQLFEQFEKLPSVAVKPAQECAWGSLVGIFVFLWIFMACRVMPHLLGKVGYISSCRRSLCAGGDILASDCEQLL